MAAPARPRAVPVVEVGGSHATAAAVDLAGSRIVPGTRHRRPLAADTDADTFLATLAEVADGVLTAGTPLHDVWGAAVPGPFDYGRGVARYRGVGKFAALDGVPVGDRLAPLLRRRPAGIRFLNDAAAFGLGVWQTWRGPGSRLVAVTLGTGVGSAFLADGAVVEDGPRVPPQGRADLLTIDGGPLEDTVSTRALTARYLDRTGRHVDGLRELTGLAARGDTTARDVVDRALRALGGALAPWLAAFDADAVVFGGAATAAWHRIGPPLTDALTAHEPRLARMGVTVCQDTERAALLGAAAHALA
ncbi:ROK family protein [Streptomyces sp. NPDC050560]|uniref:ROK family protein n=1 Tax=Streptomyces sp. NPDC050560 TaxID=3365630 RepID=UPI0037AE2DB8